MFFLDFLYYHVKLLGTKRGTAWDKGWDVILKNKLIHNNMRQLLHINKLSTI